MLLGLQLFLWLMHVWHLLQYTVPDSLQSCSLLLLAAKFILAGCMVQSVGQCV